VAQLEPLILSLQGRGKMAGLLSEGPEQRQPQEVRFGDYVLRAVFERGAPPALADGLVPSDRPTGPPPPSGGLVLETAPDEFIVGRDAPGAAHPPGAGPVLPPARAALRLLDGVLAPPLRHRAARRE
jgi:hypothetical protein